MQMYKTFVGINCHCFNHISQGDYYLNLEKDVLDIKNRFDTFNRLMELNKSLPRNRNKKDEYNKKHNKQKTSTFNSKNKPIRDNKLIRRLTIKEIEKISGMSKSDYYRKKKESYGKGTTYWTNYKKNSTKPHRVRQSKINLQTRSVVLKIRQKHQLYSKAKIKAIIDREYPDIGKKISESSIGRLLKEFSKKGLIKLGISKNKKKNKDKNNQEDKRKRNFEGTHSQAWNFEEHFIGKPKIRTETDRKKHEKHKIKNKTEIGKLIEMDHLKCERNGIKFVQFSAIDPYTRILVSKIYPMANSKNAKDFLLKTIKQFLFKIKSIQVDGGSEFRRMFSKVKESINCKYCNSERTVCCGIINSNFVF
jgi:hypothetical protein